MGYRGLAGKVAIITGAGQGIGRAYAKRLAAEGCKVVIAEANAATGNAVAGEILQAGAQATFIQTDVSRADSSAAMAERTVATYGRIDVLVNNAAIFSTIRMHPFWELTEAEWDTLMAVNLKGVWLTTKAVFPTMSSQRAGSIINVSSATIWNGRPGYLHYVAAKMGVVGATRAMARELAEYHIRANAITPGATFTEIPRDTVTPEQKAAMVEAQCVRRPESPDDLVGVVCFLASDDSAFVSGQTFNIDGGLSNH